MPWTQITVDVPDELMDAVVGEVSDDDVAGVWEGTSAEPGSSRLLIYLGCSSDPERIERRIRTIFSRSRHTEPVIARDTVEECDWTEEWKKSYSSFAIGDDFFVIPSWAPSQCPDDRLPIRIDPGQAFGTGTHETTQLTMEALERWIEQHQVVVDVGTGSGILAIASRLLGAHRVLACDIDAVAVQVARANIERNSERNVWAFCGSVDALASNSVHLLLGNLTADVIMELFDEFDRVLFTHGLVIFSGILNEQREDILELLGKRRYSVHEEMARGEWHALVAEKHGA
jgi:ribosomal protein L11 methyltransferase